MKYLVAISAICLAASCSSEKAEIAQNTNSSNAPLRAEKLQDTAVHTTENQTPKPANSSSNSGGKWSQSGDPVDTAKFDKAVADAEKASKAKSSDEAAKKTLAQAYFERGFALTEARQYASALGDYRRALKYDPEHAESKEWIDQIVNIYTMLKKPPPKEGEEPPPLPLQKPAR